MKGEQAELCSWIRVATTEPAQQVVARVKAWVRPVAEIEIHLQRLRLKGFTRRQVASEGFDAQLELLRVARARQASPATVALIELDVEDAQAEYRLAVRLENDPVAQCPGSSCGCCARAGRYNGLNDPNGRVFACPKGCVCHA